MIAPSWVHWSLPIHAHQTVNHRKGEYSVNGVTTNGMESVFAVMRRGLHGVYHKASKKHLGRYVDEFSFRLNEGNVRRHTWDQLDSFVDAVAGKRLTYESSHRAPAHEIQL